MSVLTPLGSRTADFFAHSGEDVDLPDLPQGIESRWDVKRYDATKEVKASIAGYWVMTGTNTKDRSLGLGGMPFAMPCVAQDEPLATPLTVHGPISRAICAIKVRLLACSSGGS